MIKLLMTYLSFFCLTAFAGFTDGNELYQAGDYEGAIEQYGLEIAEGKHSSELYYNLGNAHYRNGEKGKSIWAYESALKISPGHKDALFNLEFVNAQTDDKIDTSRHGFGHWLQATFFSYCVNIWAYFSMTTSFLLALFIGLFVRSKVKRNKNISLLMATIFSFLFVVSTILAYMQHDMITSRSEAVVIEDRVEIKVSPTEDAKTSFVLSEGAKVQLLSKENGWAKIDLNGNQGWLENSTFWEI